MAPEDGAYMSALLLPEFEGYKPFEDYEWWSFRLGCVECIFGKVMALSLRGSGGAGVRGRGVFGAVTWTDAAPRLL